MCNRCQAFNQWRDVRLKHPGLEREFLRRSFLSYNTLAMICQMRKQFFDHLVAIGFVAEPSSDGKTASCSICRKFSCARVGEILSIVLGGLRR